MISLNTLVILTFRETINFVAKHYNKFVLITTFHDERLNNEYGILNPE